MGVSTLPGGGGPYGDAIRLTNGLTNEKQGVESVCIIGANQNKEGVEPLFKEPCRVIKGTTYKRKPGLFLHLQQTLPFFFCNTFYFFYSHHPATPTASDLKTGTDSESESPDSQGEASEALDVSEMDFLRNLLSRSLDLQQSAPEQVLEERNLEGVAKYILSKKCERIICMVGAGISTSAGIPDFRSPGTGLYHNLQKYNLPYPEAIFEMGYFKQNPEPFFALAKELYPGQFKPTVSHYFIRMLRDKGLLLRCYTQNIDTLERVVGLRDEDLIEAHGTFYTSHCTSPTCRKQYSLDWMKTQIFTKPLPKCEQCDSVVKPDIVFFGESLPHRFFATMESDFPKCDLLIILGTSLQVQPFASLVNRVSKSTPRLLINKEITREGDPMMALLGLGNSLDFDSGKAYRDVAYVGPCDDGCLALADLLGWKEELEDIVKKEHSLIDSMAEGTQASASSQAPEEKKNKQEAENLTEKEAEKLDAQRKHASQTDHSTK